MRVEDFSRVTWLVIAVIIGGAMAWLQLQWGLTNVDPTHTQRPFEMLLLRPPLVSPKTGQQYPFVRSIVVYPPAMAGFTKMTDHPYRPMMSLIRFDQLKAAPPEKPHEQSWIWKIWKFLTSWMSSESNSDTTTPPKPTDGWTLVPCSLYAEDPYIPKLRPPELGFDADTSFANVQDYLKAVSAKYPWVTLRYAWWWEPRWAYTFWVSASVLIIGIIWPILLDRLVLAGYGRRSEERWTLWEALFDKSSKKSKSSAASAPPAPSPTTMTAEELARMEAMEAEAMEFLKTPREPGGEVDETAPEVVVQLNAAPAEAPPVAPAQPTEDKSFGGEFYPTEAHGKKKE